MAEREPIELLGKLFNVKTYEREYKPEKFAYIFIMGGLRAYLTLNYIKDLLLGRRPIAEFMIKHDM